MTPRLAWPVGLALVVAAWFVAGATPDGEDRITDPFPVAAEIGARAEGRNLGVIVQEVTLADRVSSGGWHAEGTWLVIGLDAWTIQTESPGSLGAAFLVIGDRTFRASERPGNYSPEASLLRTGLHLDLPQSGSLAFEVPADVVDDHGTLQLALSEQLWADSVIEVQLDLAALAHVAELELPVTEWATP